jgi:hypothetical protein
MNRFLVIAFILIYPAVCAQNILHVSTSGNDSNPGTAASPLRNIQTALNQSVSGDIIKVAAGTYTETITIQNRIIKGGYDGTFNDAARNFFQNKTILKPSSGTVITDNGNSTIDGFIIDGRSGATRGIVIASGHSIVTHNGIFGFLNSGGVGIQVSSGASGVIKNNSITNNILTGGGTIFYSLYILGNLNNATVVQNNITAYNDVGIHISVAGVSANYNCTYSNTYGNYSGTNGSASANDISANPRFVNSPEGDFRLKGSSPCIDSGNPADPVGDEPSPNGGRIDMGAYGGTGSATPTGSNPTTHVAISGNNSNDGSAAAPYRTIQKALTSALGDTIKVATGSYNEALVTGSRVIIRGGYSATFAEKDRDIFNNKTTIVGVSTVMLYDAYESMIDGFIFDGNAIPTDAGIKVEQGSLVTHNIVIRVNSSFAAGIETNGGAQVINNTIRSCSYGIEIRSGTGAPVIKNNIVAGNSYGMVTNAFNNSVRTYNDVYGNTFNYTGSNSTAGTGDISLDPLFRDINVATLDLRFPSNSPCVNAGDPADPVGDEPVPHGDRIDMGAYGGTKHTPYVSSLASEPSAQPTNLVFSNITTTSLTGSFTAASGNPNGYLVVRRQGGSPTGVPVDGTVYPAGSTLGDGTVVYSGSATTFDDSGLLAGTPYHYDVFAFNGSGSSINYRTAAPLEGSQTTMAPEPVNQPTNISFSSVTSTSFSVSFTPASGGPAGYIALRKSGSAPTETPTDGVAYTLGATVGSSIVAYVGNSSSFSNSGLTASTTYHIAVFAYNGTGVLTNYLTTNPLTGSQTTASPPAADSTPPSISSHTPATSVQAGSPLTVTAQFTDSESGIAKARIHFGPLSAPNFDGAISADMTNTSGNTYSYTIAASQIVDQGIYYFFYLEDVAGNNFWSSPTFVPIQYGSSGLTIPFDGFGKDQNKYRIVSIPLTLTSAAVNSVFGDDFGDYGDKSQWRMFRYQSGATQELNGSSSIVPGNGYWLLVDESRAGTTIDSGPGTTINAYFDNPHSINLSAGWNQIGNPYPYNISWQDILDLNNTTAVSKLRVYKGSWQDGTILEKFSGGFVNSSANISLAIPAYKNPAVQSGRISSPSRHPLDSKEWEVLIELSAGDVHYHLGGFGIHPKATEGHDVYDDFTLPRFESFVELNHRKKSNHIFYSRDIVPTADNHEWRFEVVTNQKEGMVELRWDNSWFGNNGKQLMLWDEWLHKPVDMRSQTFYRVPARASAPFTVWFGDDAYVKEKIAVDNLMLHPVYPNPADSEMHIAFSIPGILPQWVSLTLYDSKGNRVAVLCEEPLAAGYHERTWKRESTSQGELSAGLYVLRLQSETVQRIQKIILKQR